MYVMRLTKTDQLFLAVSPCLCDVICGCLVVMSISVIELVCQARDTSRTEERRVAIRNEFEHKFG